jgi:hypothetical protein
MKSLASPRSSDYFQAAFRVTPNAPAADAQDLGHETEVIRGLTLAAPIALLLWVPLIALAASYF